MPSENLLELEIDPDNEKAYGPCACCGQMTKRVWGYLRRNGETVAAYFVEWTPGHSDRAASFDFICGRWGDDTSADDRQGIAVAFRHIESGPSFMVINAEDRPLSKSSLVGSAATRDQVLHETLRAITFDMRDAVYFHDNRITELTSPL